MDTRTTNGEARYRARRDADNRAAPSIRPIDDDDDDDWWLPDAAEATAPDAPFRYRPGEGPTGRT
jgi:hypothetical protein